MTFSDGHEGRPGSRCQVATTLDHLGGVAVVRRYTPGWTSVNRVNEGEQ